MAFTLYSHMFHVKAINPPLPSRKSNILEGIENE
jgi:hypothetical protein